MNVLIAPDSFKGSISARDLCEAMEAGVLRAYPEARVRKFPMSDGGEGFAENAVLATGGHWERAEASDPLGRAINARFGVLGDGKTAVIESAAASGLTLLSAEERNPLVTSSYGTGQVIKRALDLGYRSIVMGLGGSATNDAGAGMLRALGMNLLDHDGTELPEGGAALQLLARLDDSGWDPRLKECSFTVVGDVVNPLCGPDGASYVYGPQKGASEAAAGQLDQALRHFAEVVRSQFGSDLLHLPGGGAAGGMGASSFYFLQGRLKPGIRWLAETYGLEEEIRKADLVLTGEGKLDKQTEAGKVVAGIAGMAASCGVPAAAIAGSVALSPEAAFRLGLSGCFSIVPGPSNLEESMASARHWVELQTAQIIRLWMSAARFTSGKEDHS